MIREWDRNRNQLVPADNTFGSIKNLQSTVINE